MPIFDWTNVIAVDCACGMVSHRLTLNVESIPNVGECEFVWTIVDGERSIWQRAKSAWRLFWHGNEVFSEVVVSHNDALALSNFVISNQPHETESV